MMASAASSLDTHAAVVISPSAEAAMNPFSQIDLDSHPSEDAAACSDSSTDNDPLVPSAPCCPVTLTVCGDPTVSSDSSSLSEASSEQHVNQIQVQSPDHDRSAPTLCPDTDPIAHPASCHVFIIQSPSPARPRCSVETYPDMECSICFSEFNNVFRCPKMLHCRHTFCLECLARINVKSTEPGAINCPLCRSLTQLPALGLPRLPTNSDVLSSLPAAMQRVYSIHFNRNKGKLQVKRSSEGHQGWGLRASRLANRSLNVGFPSPRAANSGPVGAVGGALFSLTGRPLCRALLVMLAIMMMALLMVVVIFLLTFNIDP